MSGVDERLVTLRLCRTWAGKVERGELELPVVWDLLLERLGAAVKRFQACDVCGMQPCPNPGYCQSCRSADQKIAASRKCAQCNGGGSDLEPHRDNEQRRIIYLHPQCLRFWRKTHR